MPIYIYNTLTRRKEEFKPQNPPEVKMYTCGVTVYDDCHIGHGRSLYVFDVIKRYLEYRGFRVLFVRNITDIDDKIINKAKEMDISAQEVAERFTASYREDLKLLRIDMADQEPKATENIQDMVKHIQGLIDKGYAYESGGDVYFSVRKFKGYGKLSGQSPDQMMAGARIEPGENKLDPLDFALWKSSKENEPFWDSLWGRGRPGWHIECSTMSMKYLETETLDIHAGGRDLIFPHHENEIAQAEALIGKPFAKYWIHHGLLTINSQKMAKSLGNFVTIKDFVEKYGNPDILKIFFLSAHYGSPVDFTWEKIQESEKFVKKLENFFERASQIDSTARYGTSCERLRIEKIRDKFISSMDDDFNTPEGLACVFELVDLGNQLIAQGNNSEVAYAESLLKELLQIFGLTLGRIEASLASAGVSDQEADSLIKQRDLARKRGDFRQADEIRKRLEQKGIILEDTKAGTIWRRK